MMAIDTGLQDLKRRHPEWGPWLAVVQQVLTETGNPEWDAVVPFRTEAQQNKVPLLATAAITLETRLAHRLLEQLLRIASRSGTPKMATLKPALDAEINTLSVFKASLCQEDEALKRTAAALGTDAEAFQAVAALLPIPFLHACNRRWGSCKSAGWIEGYCPTCGAWPAFAEVRGIERRRYFRCGRCGGEWQAHCLSCPYCGMTDHNEFTSLVPEKSGASGVIDACKRCLGYVKTFTRLQGSPPARVLLDDLASVDFDVAALEQGYKRPAGPGYALNLTVMENGTRPIFA